MSQGPDIQVKRVRHMADGLAWTDRQQREPAVDPVTQHNEFEEVLDLLREWPLSERLRLFEELGLSGGCDTAQLQAAFASGREAGKCEGIRLALGAVLQGAHTVEAVGENALVAAYVVTHPDGPASGRKLAEALDVAPGTAENRATRFKEAHPDLPKLDRVLPVNIG